MKHIMRLILLSFALCSAQHALGMQNIFKRSLVAASRIATRPSTVSSRLANLRAKPTMLNVLKTPMVTQPQRAIMSTRDLAGTYATNPKFSLVFGAAGYESDFVKRMIQYSNKKDATIKLAHMLFNITPHSNTLRNTQVPSLPGSWVTPYSIGKILAAAHSNQLQGNKELLALMQAERAQFVKARQLQGVSHELDNHKINQFFTMVMRALKEESEKLYETNTVNTLFLTLLYFKATSKQDIVEFYKGLGINEAAQNVLMQTHFTLEDQQRYQALMTKYPEAATFILRHRPEHAFAETINAVKSSTILPPEIPQGRNGFHGKPPVPTCVETALRNFFNILLFNPETKTIDFSVLPATVTVNPKLKEFYDQNPDFLAPKTAQAWMDLVSGHTDLGIVYLQGDYEIKSDMQNIFKFMSYFLGIEVKDCEELSTILSDNQRTISIKPQRDLSESPNFNILDISMHTKQNTIAFSLHTREGHGFVQFPRKNQKNNFYNRLRYLMPAFGGGAACSIQEILSFTHNSLSLEKDQNNHLVNAMIPFTENIHSDSSFINVPISNINLIVFSSNLKDPNVRFNLTQKLMLAYPTHPQKNKEKLLDIVAFLIRDLPDDNYFHESLGYLFLRYGVQTRDEFNIMCKKITKENLFSLAEDSILKPETAEFIYHGLELPNFQFNPRPRFHFADFHKLTTRLINLYNKLPQKAGHLAAIAETIWQHRQKLDTKTRMDRDRFTEAVQLIVDNNLGDQHPLFTTLVNEAKKIENEENLRSAFLHADRARIFEFIDADAYPNEEEYYQDGYTVNHYLIVSILQNNDIEVLERIINRAQEANKPLNFNFPVKFNLVDAQAVTPLWFVQSAEALKLLVSAGAKLNFKKENSYITSPIINYLNMADPAVILHLLETTRLKPAYCFEQYIFCNNLKNALLLIEKNYITREDALKIACSIANDKEAFFNSPKKTAEKLIQKISGHMTKTLDPIQELNYNT